MPWTLVKDAWVLVLFTVETVGGRQGGRKEAETRGTALRPGSVGSCGECGSFLPPRMPLEGKLDSFLIIKF